MAAEYTVGYRYRIHHNDMIIEGTFDGYNDGPEPGTNDQYVRLANVVVLMPVRLAPASAAQKVPRADTRNADIT